MIDDRYYIMDEYRQVRPVPRESWLESGLSRWRLHTHIFGVLVSTVFLGMNHQYLDGPPLIFETMVFDGSWDELYITRCSTYPQALWMHIKGCVWTIGYLLRKFWREECTIFR